MTKTIRSLTMAVILACSCRTAAMAEPAQPLALLARMPVKEVTVFKDGHAFLLHEGEMPVDDAGNVVMDYLPTPVLGTFWPFSVEKTAKLTAVVASKRKALVPRTSITIADLIAANTGADVHIEELMGSGWDEKIVALDGKLQGVLTRSSEELEETSPPNSGEMLPQRSNLALIKTASGVQVVPVERIHGLSFKGEYHSKLAETEFRNLLNLKLKWAGKPGKTADVGMIYLQRGLRWIPNYKVNLHADGTADVKLQATLINDLTDLSDVTTHLVIGVPSFQFAGETDPIALDQVLTQVSAQMGGSYQRQMLSNAIMAQAPSLQGATNGTIGPDDEASSAAGPEVTDSSKSEDLFVYTAKHVTLRKGQRMVLPVAEFTLKYKDVYTLEIPFVPPPEVRMTYRAPDSELAKILSEPKVMHSVRLSNQSAYPLTTAPALLLKDDQLISQAMMPYTGINGQSDLKLTTAVDITVKRTESETKRTPDAVHMQDDTFGRVDLTGSIKLTNLKTKAVEVEVKRLVLGKIASADHDGKTVLINAFEDSRAAQSRPAWWSWYDWPSWWHRVNSIGQATWTVTLAPEKPVELHYGWYYFWR